MLDYSFSVALAQSRISNQTYKLLSLKSWFNSSPSSYLMPSLSRPSYLEQYAGTSPKSQKHHTTTSIGIAVCNVPTQMQLNLFMPPHTAAFFTIL